MFYLKQVVFKICLSNGILQQLSNILNIFKYFKNCGDSVRNFRSDFLIMKFPFGKLRKGRYCSTTTRLFSLKTVSLESGRIDREACFEITISILKL